MLLDAPALTQRAHQEPVEAPSRVEITRSVETVSALRFVDEEKFGRFELESDALFARTVVEVGLSSSSSSSSSSSTCSFNTSARCSGKAYEQDKKVQRALNICGAPKEYIDNTILQTLIAYGRTELISTNVSGLNSQISKSFPQLVTDKQRKGEIIGRRML